MRVRSALVAMLAALLLGAPAAWAATVVYTVDALDSPGVSIARGCLSTSCAAERFAQDGSPDEILGSITLDDTNLLLSFSLFGNVQHDAVNGGVPGATEVDFIGIAYAAVNLLLTESSPNYFDIVGTSPANPRATVTGDVWENGADTGADLNLSARVTGYCQQFSSSVLCGLTVGTLGFGPVGLGGPTDTNVYFQHFLNVTGEPAAVPEPSISILLGLGLAGLAIARSRA